jgi:hypothetical protein
LWAYKSSHNLQIFLSHSLSFIFHHDNRENSTLCTITKCGKRLDAARVAENSYSENNIRELRKVLIMPLPIIVPGPSQIIEGYFSESENPAPSSEPWMSKPEVPSGSEIMGYCDADTYEDVILHPNRPSGVWSSATEYLGTHYELLREDAVAPLRDAVEYLRDCPDIKDNNEISVYEKVCLATGPYA